ncbi:PDZ and LIM domain protein 3-like isoform X2 [Babylonia areolata]|uniref:PDZ and LIM domain protein 3-like isoform X2 n=1 Tax=Babylonia areolata TaxID=304850 RepID=UPI003FD52089
MSNVEYQGERYQVQLRRLNTAAPWGFRLQGGVDFNTPLSVQVVQPNSISEQCGLKGGDAILAINGVNTDQLTHDEAKQEIVRGGCGLDFIVQRGTMKVWKPQVTPMSELRPQQLNTIQAATGDQFQPVQKTSLAMNSPQEPCRIGSSHNRAAQPFGGQKQAVPNVVHAQYNTPIGMYSADNIASTFATQTAGIQKEMAQLDLNQSDVGQRMTGTYQQLPASQGGQQDDAGAMPGFRSVSAPVAKPPGQQKPQQPSMRCGACDMLATGVIVKANGVPFHMGCFKCESCGMNLKQKGYFVVEGKLYCETHARRKAQPPGPNMVAVPTYR